MALKAFGDADAVTLHFDKEVRLVGIAPADREDESAYALTKGPTQQRYISASAFVRFYGISLERAKRYPARYDNGMLIVELADRPGLKEKVLHQIEREDEANGYSRESRSAGGTRKANVA